MESAPFKKTRISQEIDTESIYFHALHSVRKWHNRCTTATQREGQARGESRRHDGTYHDYHV
jgi:hypothetical protein